MTGTEPAAATGDLAGDHVDSSDGWFAVGPAADIAVAPVAVQAGQRRFVAFRPEPGDPVAVVSARCPHRLVDLSHGVVEQGRLRCPYHGWQLGADGRCA
jgi:phenylpropionate dioxygenase-like ring-hydroxylating dioxygenase large terminal subunit